MGPEKKPNAKKLRGKRPSVKKQKKKERHEKKLQEKKPSVRELKKKERHEKKQKEKERHEKKQKGKGRTGNGLNVKEQRGKIDTRERRMKKVITARQTVCGGCYLKLN